MSVEGGRSVRGCRPSRYGLVEEPCEEAELIRLANIEQYAKRASAGLPIFEEAAEAAASLISGKPSR
jgi:hypothetical protein